MNKEAGLEISRSLGEVLNVEAKAIASEQAQFLQVRVDIPVDKPLQRGASMINLEGDKE